MRAERVWLGIYGTGFVVLFALLWVTLLTPPPQGAFTRIGLVSDQAFGWRSTPPPIPMTQVRNAPLNEADVLVIGDSFSMYFAWQSPLVRAGYRVASTHWDKIGPLCGDLGPWLQRQGFRGRLVILESIERLVPERLDQSRACDRMRKAYVHIPTPPESPSQPPPLHAELNWKSRLFSGIVTWWRTRTIARTSHPFVVDPSEAALILATPLPDGCRQHSNRMCDKGLFLDLDRTNPELTAADADFMDRFAREAGAPFRVRWMVIPNKTTVYLQPEHAAAFVARANALGLGPDLYGMSQDMRWKMIDLYWPNDPHWSMQGQLYFGEQMLAEVRAAIGAPPPEGR